MCYNSDIKKLYMKEILFFIKFENYWIRYCEEFLYPNIY